MSRIIPGVEVTVVKEVVPKQLAPSGVLGVVGIIENAVDVDVIRASSFNTFQQKCGPASIYSMPEAVDALNNGVFELVIVPVKDAGTKATSVAGKLTFYARANGVWPNKRFSINAEVRMDGNDPEAVTLSVIDAVTGDPAEIFRNLTLDPNSPKYLVNVLNAKSTIVTVEADMEMVSKASKLISETGISLYDVDATSAITLKRKTGFANEYKIAIGVTVVDSENVYSVTVKNKAGSTTLYEQDELASVAAVVQTIDAWVGSVSDDVTVEYDFAMFYPETKEYVLDGGTDASAKDYADALVALEDEGDVDMVVASVQETTDKVKYKTVYDAIIGHCNLMSDDCKGRIGFGHVTIENNMNSYVDSAATIGAPLVSDRFMLLAPHGVAGAVAGMIGNLKYYQSPTFKTITGKSTLSARLTAELQRGLLRKNFAPVAVLEGRGTVVVKGITTDGDQVSVRRVADRAVRMVKSIGDEFIGKLNTDDGRTALKQKITEGLMQMEKVNAIVPHAETGAPAFMIDVYSSGADFAMGIVRVDMAVRPVRAIDYIYATITVQV